MVKAPTANIIRLPQVSDTTGDSKTLAVSQRIATLAYTTAATAQTTANTAKTTADAALPKTGGTVTGNTNFTGRLQIGSVDVLKAGDGGIALSTQVATNNIDIDTYDFKVGFYSGNMWSASIKGLPFGSTSSGSWFYLLNQNLASSGSNYKLQILGLNQSGTNRLAVRYKVNGAFTSWVELITTANVASWVAGLGIGQTWQDVTASRAKNTTYTNTTGKPIQVVIVISQGGSAITYFYVDGLKMAVSGNISNVAERTISIIVPNGSTYMTTDNFIGWNELR